MANKIQISSELTLSAYEHDTHVNFVTLRFLFIGIDTEMKFEQYSFL